MFKKKLVGVFLNKKNQLTCTYKIYPKRSKKKSQSAFRKKKEFMKFISKGSFEAPLKENPKWFNTYIYLKSPKKILKCL